MLEDPAFLQRIAERHQHHVGAAGVDAPGQGGARGGELGIAVAGPDHVLAQRLPQRLRSGLGHARTPAQQEEAQRPPAVPAQVRNQVGAIEVAGEAAAMHQQRAQVHTNAVVDDAHARRAQPRAQRLTLHHEVGVGEEHQALLAMRLRLEQRIGERRFGGA